MHDNIIRQRIDGGGMSAAQLTVVIICFILNMLDGFDIVAMSVAASNVQAEWGMTNQQKGYILSAALLGMTLGATFLAPLSDKYGRRTMILLAAMGSGIGMIVTGLLPQSTTLLFIVRTITGLGIGVMMASTTTIAIEFTPEKWRNLVVAVVVAGYPFGASVVAPIWQIVRPHGWEYLFYTGGVFTLIIAALMVYLLPESIDFLANSKADSEADKLGKINRILQYIKRAPIDALPPPPAEDLKAAKVSSLFVPQLYWITIPVWTVFFLCLLTLYFFLAWLPSVLEDAGFSPHDAAELFKWFTMSGSIGTIIFGILTTKYNLTNTIILFFAMTVISMMIISFGRLDDIIVLGSLLSFISFIYMSAYTGMYTLASRVYPAVIRATGVGWAIGLGRIGAIISPIIVGFLVAELDWSIYELFFAFAFPVLIAAMMVYTLRNKY